MAITALPALNRTASTFRDDVDTFFGTQLPTFSVETEAARVEINSNTTTATTQAQLATTQAQLATTQATAAAASALSAGATIWVSGTTYTAGVSKYSPLNGQVYRRMITGAGTTDPSLDPVNWRVVNGLTSELIVLPFNNLPSMRPSLNLDFANNQTVDPRITFTRASTATRTNSKGLVEVVASGVPRIDYDAVTGVCKGLLIEESRVNLLTYSEQFDNAAWVKTNSTVTANATTAPDGTTTADKLVESSGTVSPRIAQNFTSSPGTVYAESIYLKAGERTQCHIIFHDGVTVHAALLNLSSGAVSANVVPGLTDTSATTTLVPVGNGWYRASIPKTAAGTTYQLSIRIYNASDNYTGDGTSGLYLWGAQLEAGAFPTSYQPSTETFTGRASTATFYGSNGLLQTAASGVARMNYNPMNLTVAPKLLLEGAGTNLLTYSEQFDNAAWVQSVDADTSVTANATTAPDGTLTADKLFEATTTPSSHGVYEVVASTPDSTTHTFSVYLKAGERTHAVVSIMDKSATTRGAKFDLSSGTVSSFNADGITDPTSYSIVSVGSGWYRCVVSQSTATGGFNPRAFVSITNGSTISYAGVVNSGIFIWGAQLEASPYATSYIPTVASQVTRVADTSTSAQTTRAADVASMTGVNFSSWYRQEEGSFVAETLLSRQASSRSGQYALSDGATNSFSVFYRSSGATGLTVIAAGVTQADISPTGVIPANTPAKTSFSYRVNDFASSGNGLTVAADSSGAIPTLDRLFVGADIGNYINGHLRSLSYYPKRLTNAELQALSTQ